MWLKSHKMSTYLYLINNAWINHKSLILWLEQDANNLLWQIIRAINIALHEEN